MAARRIRRLIVMWLVGLPPHSPGRRHGLVALHALPLASGGSPVCGTASSACGVLEVRLLTGFHMMWSSFESVLITKLLVRSH
jgi:hypothetical protein